MARSASLRAASTSSSDTGRRMPETARMLRAQFRIASLADAAQALRGLALRDLFQRGWAAMIWR